MDAGGAAFSCPTLRRVEVTVGHDVRRRLALWRPSRPGRQPDTGRPALGWNSSAKYVLWYIPSEQHPPVCPGHLGRQSERRLGGGGIERGKFDGALRRRHL